MSGYLDFYELEKPPFAVKRSGLVLATEPLRAVLAWIGAGIDGGAPLMCVTGTPGVGRTSLARVLPRVLAAEARMALVPHPARPWEELTRSIACQLQLTGGLSRDALVAGRALGQRLVIAIDGAERASEEILSHLTRLLDRRGPAGERLVQLVLTGRLALGGQVPEAPLWKWLDAHGASCTELEPISPNEIHRYIRKRLEYAGRPRGQLFTETASLVVHRHSNGVPQRINEVCHQTMREALRRCSRLVDARLVAEAMA